MTVTGKSRSTLATQPSAAEVKVGRGRRSLRVPHIRGQGRELSLAVAFLLPALGLLVIFRLWPLVESIRLSFMTWDGFTSPTWSGLKNFRAVLSDPIFRTALFNNIKLLIAIPLWVVIPLLLAQAIHARVWGWQFFRLALFLPATISPVVLGIYYGLALGPNGPLNDALRLLGLEGWAKQWLNEPGYAFIIVIGVLIWSTLGIGTLIFLAGLASLDGDVVEAARVDGASRLQIELRIIVWMLIPVIRFWTIIIFIAAFSGIFPLVFSLTGGGPGYSTYTLEFDVYEQAFNSSRLGYANAIGTILLVMVGVATVIISAALRNRDG